MLTELIVDIFKRISHTWSTTEGPVQPTEEDVQQVLDSAASRLYDEGNGTRLETGGLIIDRRNGMNDVYIYLGTYE